MFYKMIERARDRWYASQECTVADLIKYMTQKGNLRDAQIEAIKTYLYLKVACNCQSLKKLFCQGTFNTLNLDDLEISKSTREFLKGKKAAAALLEYALLTNEAGDQVGNEGYSSNGKRIGDLSGYVVDVVAASSCT